MSGPSPRFDACALRRLVIGAGLCWSVAFVVIALRYQLELYGDGAMFSYAVAVQDVWAFHWHNISGRSSVFFSVCGRPRPWSESPGRPWAGIITYGLLFYISPLIGLIVHLRGRSLARPIHLFLCLLFDRPALPAHLRLSNRDVAGPRDLLACAGAQPLREANRRWSNSVFAAQLLLAFTHEGALVLLFAIVATLAPRGLRSVQFVRAMISLTVILTLAAASKFVLPPDDYYAGVLLRAALHFFDPEVFKVEVVLLLLAALTAYGAIFAAISMISPERAWIYSLGIVLVPLSIYWLQFDHSVHASSRYYLRTVLVLLTPVFGAVAALSAMAGDGIIFSPLAGLQHTLISPGNQALRVLAGAFAVAMLIHAVETEKFVTAWTDYRNAVAALATGQDADP